MVTLNSVVVNYHSCFGKSGSNKTMLIQKNPILSNCNFVLKCELCPWINSQVESLLTSQKVRYVVITHYGKFYFDHTPNHLQADG